MDDTLSATGAGAVASRARKLLAKGRITHRQYALLDCLLWVCRTPGRATARVSYSILKERAYQARSTVAAGIKVLLSLGLIQRARHRILVTGQNGGRVWKQLTNVYRLIVRSEREFDDRTDSKTQEITSLGSTVLSGAVKEAQEALRRIAQGREAQRVADWQRGHTRRPGRTEYMGSLTQAVAATRSFSTAINHQLSYEDSTWTDS